MARSKTKSTKSSGQIRKQMIHGNPGVSKKHKKQHYKHPSELTIDTDIFTQFVQEITAEVLEGNEVYNGPIWDTEAIGTLQAATEGFIVASDNWMKKVPGRDVLQLRDFKTMQSLRKAQKGYYVVPGKDVGVMKSFIIEECGETAVENVDVE